MVKLIFVGKKMKGEEQASELFSSKSNYRFCYFKFHGPDKEFLQYHKDLNRAYLWKKKNNTF